MTGGRTVGGAWAAGLASFGVIVVAGVEGKGVLVVAGVVGVGGFIAVEPALIAIGFGPVTAGEGAAGERAITGGVDCVAGVEIDCGCEPANGGSVDSRVVGRLVTRGTDGVLAGGRVALLGGGDTLGGAGEEGGAAIGGSAVCVNDAGSRCPALL